MGVDVKKDGSELDALGILEAVTGPRGIHVIVEKAKEKLAYSKRELENALRRQRLEAEKILRLQGSISGQEDMVLTLEASVKEWGVENIRTVSVSAPENETRAADERPVSRRTLISDMDPSIQEHLNAGKCINVGPKGKLCGKRRNLKHEGDDDGIFYCKTHWARLLKGE